MNEENAIRSSSLQKENKSKENKNRKKTPLDYKELRKFLFLDAQINAALRPQKNFSSQQMGTITENCTNKDAETKRLCGVLFQLVYKTIPVPTPQGSLPKMRGKNSKKPQEQAFPARLCLLECQEVYTHKVSTTWLPKQDLNKDNSNGHTRENSKASTPDKEPLATREFRELKK